MERGEELNEEVLAREELREGFCDGGGGSKGIEVGMQGWGEGWGVVEEERPCHNSPL